MKKPANLYNNEKFNRLKEKWYKKLEKSGFEDIEQDDKTLKIWSSRFANKKSIYSWQAKATYYQMAVSFLEDYKFDSKKERMIWQYHSEGFGAKDTAEKLNRKPRKKRITQSYVRTTVKKLKMSMYSMYLEPLKPYYE